MSSDNLAEANKKAFDAFAETYNTHPWQQRLAAQILEALQKRKAWLGVSWAEEDDGCKVKLLDYACGTGAASIALWPWVTEIRGMDLSDGMVKRYNEAMGRIGLSYEQAHAVATDLVNDSAETVNVEDLYDVAIVSLALHHVTNPELLIRRLAARLKPGTGVLIIIDFVPFEHGHGSHGHKGFLASMAHTITQHGFDEHQMTSLFTQAGLKDIGFQVDDQATLVSDDDEEDNKRHMFVARATKAA